MLELPKERIEKLPEEIAKLARETYEILLLTLPGNQFRKEVLISMAMELAGPTINIQDDIQEFDNLKAEQQLQKFAKLLLAFCWIYARLFVYHNIYIDTVLGSDKVDLRVSAVVMNHLAAKGPSTVKELKNALEEWEEWKLVVNEEELIKLLKGHQAAGWISESDGKWMVTETGRKLVERSLKVQESSHESKER